MFWGGGAVWFWLIVWGFFFLKKTNLEAWSQNKHLFDFK